jgi:chorismate dehydratase
MFTLGIVPYLNALPLYRTLEVSGEARLVRVVPSQLAQHLEAGELDVALMPVVDYFRGYGERLISDACIGSSGAVRSVLLFSRGPIERISRVAVDSSSHSSVALLRILLADGYGLRPNFIEHAPNLHEMLEVGDAALVIGDQALEAARQNSNGELRILDLGEAWLQLTGKPFVFAAWIARRGLEMERAADLEQLLNQSRTIGLRNLETIVRENPIPTQLSPAEVEDYLRHAVVFTLTEAHRAGMAEFRRRCEKHGLLE